MTDDIVASPKSRVDFLQEILLNIAVLADGHRRSTLYVDGANVALPSVLSIVAGAIGRSDDLHRDGTFLAPAGTVIEVIDGILVGRPPTGDNRR